MRKQSGIALLPVAIIITVIAAVSLLLSYESSMNVNETAAQNESKQADLVAEAGMAHAKWQLQQNTNCTGYTNVSSTNFGSHSYTANINPTNGSPITVSANGVSSSGITRTLVDAHMKMYQTPLTKEYILDATGKDTFIEGESGHTDHNKGSDNHIIIKSETNKLERGLVQFDLSDIPTNSKIINATLGLYLNDSKGNSQEVFIHRVTGDWVEDEVTWEIKRFGLFQDWMPQGGEYAATVSGTFTADVVGWKSAEITQLVQDWVKVPNINQGMILLSVPVSGNNEKKFISSDDGDATLHPKLTVTFACECGQSCVLAGVGRSILSTEGNATLGGLDFSDKDLAEYDSGLDTANLYLDGVALGLAQDVDAVHVLANNHILLSTINTSTLGGLNFENEDVIDYDPNADVATILFDGSERFTNGSTDISAVHVMESGNLLLTNEYNATLGGLNFEPNDIIEYNFSSDTAIMFLDGDAVGLSGLIDAVHLLSNGHIVLSTKDDATLGGLSFQDGDLVMYDPVNDIATLHFSENKFSADENIRSVHIGSGKGSLNGNLPLAHWKLDETSGTIAIDSVGGHDGTLTPLIGGPTWTAGQIDGGLNFDGNDDHIVIPHGDTLSLEQSLTFTAWVYSTDLNMFDLVLSKGNNSSTYAYYFGTEDDEISFGFKDASFHIFSTPNLNLATNTWHHLAVTFSNSDDRIILYHNGVEVHSATTTLDLPVNTNDLYIGSSENGADWNGVLDDVRIYDRVLSASEIEELADLSGLLPIAHWKLDDGTGSKAVDSIGGHDGTLGNEPNWVAGTVGDALEFDGSDDYVDLTSDAELDDIFINGATVLAWIYPTGWGENGYGRIFDKSSSPSSTGDGWVIRMNKDNSGIINFGQGFTGGRGWWKIPNGSISLNTWQHITVAYDASSVTNDPQIYLNGSPVAVTKVDKPSGSIRSDASINLRLGNYAGGTTHTFDGKIDDARIYDRILDAAEIVDIATGSGGDKEEPLPPEDCTGTFRDEFNTFENYSGSDGTLKWSTDWLEINESDGPDSGDERVDDNDSKYHLQIRDNDGGGEGVQREADLSKYIKSGFTFEYRRDGFDNNSDYVTIEVSSNGGSSWTQLERIGGSGTDSSYIKKGYDISVHTASNTRIRFLTSPNLGSGDEFYIDNVQIEVKGCKE